MPGRYTLQVERRHGDRRREESRLQVDEYQRAPQDRIDIEVLEQRQEDRHEDDDDLGPLERPAEEEDDRLRQDQELHRRHVEAQYPGLDQLLAAQDREHPREQRRADEQPAHHCSGFGGEKYGLLEAFPVELASLKRKQICASSTDPGRLGGGGYAEQDHREHHDGQNAERHDRRNQQLQQLEGLRLQLPVIPEE